MVLSPGDTLRWLNAVAWLVVGYSIAPGLIHLGYFVDAAHMQTDFLIWPWLTGGLIYSAGAILYAIGFPERYFKKKFDYFG